VADALAEVRRLREKDHIVEALTPKPTSFTFQVEAIDGIPEAIIDREKRTAIERVAPHLPIVWHEEKAEHSGIKYTTYTGRLFVMPEVKPLGQGVAALLPEHGEAVCTWREAGTLLRASCDDKHRGHGQRPEVCPYCGKPTVFV
jgi:hypothetical protein